MGCVFVNLSSSDDSSKKCPCVWWKWKLYLSQTEVCNTKSSSSSMWLTNYIQPWSCMSCAIVYICFKDARQRPYNWQSLNSRKSPKWLWPSRHPSTRFEMFDPSMPKVWGAKVWVYSLRNGLWLANLYDKSDDHKPHFDSTKSRCSTSLLGAKRHPEYFILATQDISGVSFAINSGDLHQNLCPDCFLQVHHQWTGSPG